MHVLVTRPVEDGEEIAARLAEMGHTALLAPLLSTHFSDGPEPDLRDVFLGWRQTIRRQRLERDRLVLTAEARVL